MDTEELDIEGQLQQDILNFYYDPLGFVYYVFNWGHDELSEETGPDKWQRDYMLQLGKDLQSGNVVKIAMTSGHGPGKTCLVAWLILWFQSTHPGCAGVTTANTRDQLKTKTWRELAKWHKLSINRHWFKHTATRFFRLGNDINGNALGATWGMDAIPWTENNSESFAGTHESAGTLMIFDEASAISSIIWEVVEGAMTTQGAIWLVFGNPTRNSGAFSDCFNKVNSQWRTYKVDSRDAKKVDIRWAQNLIKEYGEDHDLVRVRIKGEFPRAGSMQFIPTSDLDSCINLKVPVNSYSHMPFIFGVDIARSPGDNNDDTVLCVRQGRKIHTFFSYHGYDTMEVADMVREKLVEYRPDYIFIDGIGIGSGVVDRLNQLGYNDLVWDIVASRKSSNRVYANKRAEMYARLRDAIRMNIDFPICPELFQELRSLEFGYNARDQIQLERKIDLKARIGRSPDFADALSLTYAEEISEIEVDEYEYEYNEGTGINMVTGY